MYKLNLSLTGIMQWLVSRVAVVYVIVFLFCLTCMDLKTLGERVKVRHLNDAIPDFSDMIIFSKDQGAKTDIDWKPYKDYFELVFHYLPKDLIIRQLLGYVDYYMGRRQEAINLFKNSSTMDGKFLFWSNYDLGVIYYKEGMLSQATQYLLNAIASNTNLAILLMQHSIVYKQIFVSPYFKYSLSDDLDDAQSRAYILLLSSLYHMKQYAKVVIISNLGINNQELLYKDAFYYYQGLAYYEMGQFQTALVLFQESLTIEKDNPDVYYYIADMYQKAGKFEQAHELFQVSYALHQKNDPRFPYDNQLDLRVF